MTREVIAEKTWDNGTRAALLSSPEGWEVRESKMGSEEFHIFSSLDTARERYEEVLELIQLELDYCL